MRTIMCVTSLEAELSKTRIGAWDIDHPAYGYRHVLCYQNQARSLVEAPNCMLLHIPSVEALGPESIINTENDLQLLIELERPHFPVFRGKFGINHVVEMGVYHIAILNNPSPEGLKQALKLIPENKRPKIDSELVQFYTRQFPGFPLVLCCFNNQDSRMASPIMLHFNPVRPEVFMFNTLDSHGGIPELKEDLRFHQTIITGSYKIREACKRFKKFDLKNVSEALHEWIPDFGTAFKINKTLPNRDVLIDIDKFLVDESKAIRLGFLNDAA